MGEGRETARSRTRRRIELAVFAIYLAWCLVALVEITGRRILGTSPWPGFLADHNGNLAVSGFIVPFGFAGRVLRDSRWLPERAAYVLGLAIVALAAAAWTVFFVVMELADVYAHNHRDGGDIPASLFGAFCGTWAAVRLATATARPAWCRARGR